MTNVNEHKSLSLWEKMVILCKCDKNTVLKENDLAKSLFIPGSTLQMILKSRQEVEKNVWVVTVKRFRPENLMS